VSRGRAVFLVARREFRERLRGRGFRASTGVMILAVLGIMSVSALTSPGGPQDVTVAVSGDGPTAVAETATSIQSDFGLRVDVARAGDPADARGLVTAGDAGGAVTDDGLVLADGAPTELEALLQAASRRVRAEEALADTGLEPTEVRAVLVPPPLPVEQIGGPDDEAAALSFLVALLLYIGIFTFGYYVASGVVEEKTSRVVEVVLSAIRPLTLLAGKVVGIGLLGLAQLAAIAGIGLGAALVFDQVDVPAAASATIALALVYFVLGYVFYACAFAAAGAIVARHEDLQSTTAPVSVLLVGSYFAVLPVIDSPDSALARITTFLPPVAPMTVPARAAQDALPAWELALSLVAMLAGIALMLLAATRIYERSVLRLGAPLKLRQALRLTVMTRGERRRA
jgi:ABC-2 type transport system permease protein